MPWCNLHNMPDVREFSYIIADRLVLKYFTCRQKEVVILVYCSDDNFVKSARYDIMENTITHAHTKQKQTERTVTVSLHAPLHSSCSLIMTVNSSPGAGRCPMDGLIPKITRARDNLCCRPSGETSASFPLSLCTFNSKETKSLSLSNLQSPSCLLLFCCCLDSCQGEVYEGPPQPNLKSEGPIRTWCLLRKWA